MTTAFHSDPPHSSQSPSSAERLASRIGARLASPLGILLIMPGLVSLVGAFLSLLGDDSLRSSNLAVAKERMTEQARLSARSVREALEQADATLDRLHDLVLRHDPGKPVAPLAHAMLDLMQGRPGVTYMSVSFPDGTFQGAYVDTDGVTRFADMRVGATATEAIRYEFGRRDELRLVRREQNAYDPRVRGFYLLATAQQRRVWTEPYLFYDSQITGITRAEPIYEELAGARTLHAVVTIDYDVNGLSSYLGSRQLQGMRALLFSREGTILAYASDPQDALPLIPHDGQPLRFADVHDPLLTAFFAEVHSDHSERARALTVSLDGEAYLSAIEPVTSDPALPWSLAYMVPERSFLSALYSYEDRTMFVGGFAVLLSTLLAYWFARHITRVRDEATEAKAEARQARALAREARAEARELGSYRLVACLGRGGMGEVWRAQHRLLAREAAIKLIKTDDVSLSSSSLRERFRREAEALARLRSRNTIELFDYGVADDGTFYLVMELLDGVDFDTLVLKHGVQPPARVVKLLIQACQSLAEAHSAGLVHRDIKPANLFICRAAEEYDVVKVLDFGLVRTVLDMNEAPLEPPQADAVPPISMRVTQADGMVGTPAYMAPEQVQGRAIDGRADLYALGGVAFWLLTGHVVFEHDNVVEQLLAHLHTPLAGLRERLPVEVPDELVQLIAGCLAKQPDDRPRDAASLARALKAIPFPPEHAWSEDSARAWWQTHRPERFQPSEPPLAIAPRELSLGATLARSER